MKKRKLLQKILSGSKNIRFDELIALLEAFGFVLRRITGSHHIYKHPSVSDLISVQLTKNGQAKPYQITALLKLIEEYDLELEDESDEGDDK